MRSQAEEALRARQTSERKMMLDLLMEQTKAEENETLQRYLQKEKRDAERDLGVFRKAKEREVAEKLREL